MTLIFRTGTASRDQILGNLKACDASYVPALSSRIDLVAYSQKLHEKAISFEAWEGDILIGMLNAYLGRPSQEFGFISNVSVLPAYGGRGIARTLLRMCFEDAAQRGLSSIRLEVAPANLAAVRLYSQAGFQPLGAIGENALLQAMIPTTAPRRR